MAREGGVARAGERLPLTPHTTSGKPSLVQEYLGVDVFSRIGRSLELTDTGRTVLSYADEISSLDGEREDVIPRLPEGRLQLLRVGTVDVVPGLSPIVFLCLRC